MLLFGFLDYTENMAIKTTHKSFLWGVTQIGQQVEGSCFFSNWSLWARRGLVPVCGRGNNYWHRYKEDHDLVEELGVGAYRLSIDWARIEPQEGVFDEEAIAHYRRMLHDLKKRHITTVVGLWHYSAPLWFDERYGMHHQRAGNLFLRFATYVRDTLGDVIDMVVVLNEPMVYIGTGYVQGTRPPFFKSPWHAWRALRTLARIHNATYDLWKKRYPDVDVGSTHLWNDLESAQGRWLEKCAVALSKYFRLGYIINKTLTKSDYLGINYYTADKIYFRGVKYIFTGIMGFHGSADWHSPDVWRDFPQGLSRVLMSASTYKKPLYILENGKPTNRGCDDTDRQEFLRECVDVVLRAKNSGVDVRGYFHYALADAYEWDSGYDFAFGLVEINRDTLERTRRKSFAVYKSIINTHANIS